MFLPFQYNSAGANNLNQTTYGNMPATHTIKENSVFNYLETLGMGDPTIRPNFPYPNYDIGLLRPSVLVLSSLNQPGLQ